MLLGEQPDTLRNELRRLVVGIDHGDNAVDPELRVCGSTAGGGRFGSVPATLVSGRHVLADLDLFDAVDDLDGQSALTDELAGVL